MGTKAVEFIGTSEKEAASRLLAIVTPIAKKYGLLPSVATAQCILESGYCKTDLAIHANNVCGMKCSLSGNTWAGSTWDGTSKYDKITQEDDGKGNLYNVNAGFRAYPCIEDSIADRCAYLLGAKKGSELRYKGIQKSRNYTEQIQLIKDGGYATDIHYVDKICNIIERFDLAVNDTVSETEPKKEEKPDSEKKIVRLGTRRINNIMARNRNQVPASRGATKPEFIVIHYLGVPSADNADLYGGGYGGHFNIYRNGTIYQAASPAKDVVWHCGGGLQGTGGHSFYGICGNYNSIGIECGVEYTEKVASADADSNKWYFTEETQESLVWLVSKLMDEFDIPIEHTVRHFDVTGKICPNPYVKNNHTRTSWTWNEFKQNLAQYRENGTITIPDSSSAVPEPTVEERNYLKIGDTGEKVKAMQKMLNATIKANLAEDGIFGPATETSLKHFQKREALTIDGLYGPVTEATLKHMYADKTAKPSEKNVLYRVQTGAFKYSKTCRMHLEKIHNAGFTDAFMTDRRVDGFYRCQVGSYSIKSNAEKMVERVKKAGYDAIIKEYTA